jgi:hypothetical protein
MSVEPFWPYWGACSDPPEESCSDAGCPVHGDPPREAWAKEQAGASDDV